MPTATARCPSLTTSTRAARVWPVPAMHDPAPVPLPLELAYAALPPEAAFDAVFAREKTRLYHLALSVLHDRAEAEDAVQETMWRAWKAWSSVRDESKRSAWLTKICLHHCFRRKRRLDRSAPWDTTDPVAADAGRLPGQPVGAAASAGRAVHDPDLDRAYRKLPPKQRAAIVLHYHHGYSIEQTAAVMGCRAGTVRTHVQRALATLRKELGDA